MTESISHSLDPIFSPRTVAVIGASRRPNSIGYSILHNLLQGGFTGALYPINPGARAIHSLRAYPDLASVPDPIDLAMIVVPRDAVLAVVDDCIAHGVRGLVVITAGFAEVDESGAALEREVCEKVRAAGIRMMGPNCMGVINTDPDIRLNATFAPIGAGHGSIGFVSQSGALGVAILNVAADLGVGFTQFASMGNKADVSGNDLAEYWENHEATKIVAMYLESFGNPRRFTEIAKRVGRKKPVLMVKSGRTAEGARAASSHTGALAGADITVSTLLEQCGVLRVDTIQDLFDVARAFDRCPLPAGKGVAILTNSGGPGIMATDACVNLGLEIAELGAKTRERLESFLPREASTGNPVDMIASANAESYRRAVPALLADPDVDMLIAIFVTPLLASPVDILEAIAEGMEKAPEKPVLAVMMAEESFYDATKTRRDLPPVYRFPESAAGALSVLARYAAWRERPTEAPSVYDVDDLEVSKILRRAGEGYLDAGDAFRVLEIYGIPTAPWRVAHDGASAAEAASELHFPLVVKAVAPKLVHKSDLGGVALGLTSAEEVARTVESMQRRLTEAGHPPASYLVQEQLLGGHEVVFGLSTDERFGPVLMFGMGGKYVEVMEDVTFGVTPLLPHEAEEMIEGIRGIRLLEGFRGEPPADRELLRDVLLRLAQLAERHPEIRELDINPFLAAPEASDARALDVRIRVGPASTGI